MATNRSQGSPLAAVACKAKGPKVAVSVALPATLYQPDEISVTEPDAAPKAAPFLLRVTVGEAPVRPVI